MRLILFALVACLSGSALSAQNPTSVYTTRLFDTVLTYAPPPWVTSPDQIGSSESFRNQAPTPQGTRSFILEFIPKGESFEAWTRLYAITAETPLNEKLTGYRDGQIQRYVDACVDAKWQIARGTPKDIAFFTVFCPHYKANPDMGEVAVFQMMMYAKTLVKTYYHIRTPAFSVTDLTGPEANWPVTRDELTRGTATVARARLSVAD